jgi:hypothetical protein
MQVWLVHVSNANPTLLNGTPCMLEMPLCLEHGDKFVIAGRVFRFDYGEHTEIM